MDRFSTKSPGLSSSGGANEPGPDGVPRFEADRGCIMTNEEQRIVELQKTMHQMVDHYIKALEILINQVVLNRADPDTLQWVHTYLDDMQATLKTFIADQTKARHPPMKTRTAIEELEELEELEGFLLQAEQLKKTPGNQ